ncbi:TetR-like C-terminal domain-containing protein [Anaerosporobacter sp.]|uniref:TetR-like C-terminal domain-containing protein n=1 Tax=Anaerosporobacter sp. TaxID=1872529 RepID=UPI00286F9B6F|nr:TetR-like C-terminal domain-containing protein [Anaerosporobacter sp.]
MQITNFQNLFSLLYRNGLITVIMQIFETLIPAGEIYDKATSYLMSYFTYGYFGIIYQWIRYDFDETPEQVRQHITNTFGIKKTD